VSGREVILDVQSAAKGDVARTGGDAARAASLLGWSPSVGLEGGLERQVAWHRSRQTAPA
jgi:nucleoside-diphosphate-sugar epimerase